MVSELRPRCGVCQKFSFSAIFVRGVTFPATQFELTNAVIRVEIDFTWKRLFQRRPVGEVIVD